MIYKLHNHSEEDTALETYLSNQSDNTVVLKITDFNDEDSFRVQLNESQLFKLIGVLHLLQKEQKEVNNG